jgi:S-DNA-T family DNA segregation ATPase FtsK/SpoIIIE
VRAAPVGLGDDAHPWRFRLQGTHALIAGATGAGKGSVLWSLLHGLAPAIADGWVQVWALDPKGGMELGLGRGVFERFEGGVSEAMCDLLEEAVNVKTRRSLDLATHGHRVHTAAPDSPHIVVVVDELATLTAFAERAVVRRIDQALGLLLTQGRAVGITVVAAVQDPGKDVVTWRDLFPTRIAMRLDNPIQVDMVLGDGARDRGAYADHISERTPGVAYVRMEGSRDIRRVRAAYLTDDDVTALSTALARRRTATSARSTDEAGEAA